MTRYTLSYLAHQVTGLNQHGQQDLHHHLHPQWLLGGCGSRAWSVGILLLAFLDASLNVSEDITAFCRALEDAEAHQKQQVLEGNGPSL